MQARLHRQLFARSLVFSFSLSFPLSSPLIHSSLKGFPSPSLVTNLLFSPPLSPPCFVYQGQQGLHWHDLSSAGSRTARHPPSGPYVVNLSSESCFPSASILCVFRGCRPLIVTAAFGCRLCPGHQHQRHRCWQSMLLLYFVCFAARWTVDCGSLLRVLQRTRMQGIEGFTDSLAVSAMIRCQHCSGISRNSRQHLIV